MGGAPRPCATCRVLWGGWRGDGGERACAIIARAIVPILRAAKEIEEENPRVAYLCRYVAFVKVHTLDPNSSGRGVQQFKTYLLHRLEKDEQERRRKLASSDAREIQMFYEYYCTKHIGEDHDRSKPEEIAGYYQIAPLLYDVLKTVTHSAIPKNNR